MAEMKKKRQAKQKHKTRGGDPIEFGGYEGRGEKKEDGGRKERKCKEGRRRYGSKAGTPY